MVVVPLRKDILDNDLTLVYIGVRIALEHGWSHVYSLSLQHQLFTQLRPQAPFNDGERFVSPPPLAWLVLPLSLFGAAGATYAWLAGSVLALVGTWWLAAPGSGRTRALWLIAALAWYPVLYSLSLAQPDLLIGLVVVAAWRLSEARRPYLAGVVLGLSVLKPQLTLVLPLVLLAGGRWKIAGAWAATAAVLAAISLVLIGAQGLNDYRALLNEAQHVTNNRYFTLAYVLGPGGLSYAAQALVTVIAMIAAYLNRGEGHARLFALGILATALGATYWHLQDYAILVPAAWLFLRDQAPARSSGPREITPQARIAWRFQRWWLLVVVVGGELAWPLRPLPLLIGVAVWFVFLAAPRGRAVRAPEAAPA